MPKRIIVTYSCDHDGKKLPPRSDKYWDIMPRHHEKVCYCRPIPTLMKSTIEVKDDHQPS